MLITGESNRPSRRIRTGKRDLEMAILNHLYLDWKTSVTNKYFFSDSLRYGVASIAMKLLSVRLTLEYTVLENLGLLVRSQTLTNFPRLLAARKDHQ